MAIETELKFIVQSFRAKGRALVAEQPQSATSKEHALRMVERMATGKAGAVALEQRGNFDLGEYDEPTVLRIIGQVPPVYLDAIPF